MSHTSKQHRFRIIGAAGALALALTVAPTRLAGQATIDTLAYPGPGSAGGFGTTIAGVGDIDGDGHDDFVAGNKFGGVNGFGLVQLFSGADLTVLRTWDGDAAGDDFGWAVDSAGDIDGDGLDDVVVGAPLADVAGYNSGVVRVYSCATGALLHELPGLDAGDRFGLVVAGLGDLDGDGRGDFAGATTHGGAPGVALLGYVRIVSGGDGHELVLIAGHLEGDQVGANVRPAGDFNADGTPDVAVMMAPMFQQFHALVYSGAWIVDGALPAVLLDYTDPSLRFAMDGAGDLNLDGWGDLLLGTPFIQLPTGGYHGGWRAISGKDHALLFEWVDPVVMNFSGATVAGAGDLDQDGHPDLLVAASENVSPFEPSGPVRAFSGRDGSVLYTCPPNGAYNMGVGLAAVGDLNADGFRDWAVGTPSVAGTITLYSPAGIWNDLGHGLAGSAGVPALSGTGLLLGGDGVSVALTGALPSQPVLLVIGLGAVNLPFHGGVFVPNADLLLVDVTDAGGGQQWSSAWPLDVPTMSFYFQAWMEDPAAVEGWAASNGLRAQSP